MELRRTILLTGLLCLMSSFVLSSSAFHGPSIEGNTHPQTSFNITINSSANFSDPTIQYKPLSTQEWESCQVSNNVCTINGLSQGVYEYYAINGTNTSTQFPTTGSLRFVVAQDQTTYYNKANNLTVTDPTNDNFGDSCQPWNNDYSCALGPFQASMIQSFSKAFRITDNNTYLEKANNTSITEYDEFDVYATCDRANNDYDCQNSTGDEPDISFIPKSGFRQASLAAGLGRASRMTGLEIAKEEGITYMKGSAENCDIWNGDFSCNSVNNQGRMVQAAWETYLTTGNESYRNQALTLAETLYEMKSSIGKQDYPAIRGLLTAYQMTENSTYRDTANELVGTYGDQCINSGNASTCSVRTQTDAIMALIDGYRITGESFYSYYAEQTLETPFNGTCNPWNGSYACATADRQGDAAQAFWQGYTSLPELNTTLSHPRTYGNMTLNSNITFHVDISGSPETLTLNVRRFNGTEWNSCDIKRQTGNCTIDGSSFRQQTSYQYFFNTSSGQFPQRYFTFVLGLQNDTYEDYARQVTETEPTPCGPWSEDFSCSFVHLQGWYVTGMTASHDFTQNKTLLEHSTSFATTPYDPNDEGSFCDQADNDFSCDATRTPNGSVRQGKIMEGLWDSYRFSGNETVRELALNYTQNAPNDCDPWNNEYSCGSERGQGNMINGLLAAYTVTGNSTYLDKAESFANQATDNIASSRLIDALWTVHGIAGHTDAKQKAKNNTINVLESCSNDQCNAREYANTFTAGMSAYEQTDNDTYHDKSYEMLENGSSSTCNPVNGSYECEDADGQGSMIQAFWQAFNNFFSEVDGDASIEIAQEKLNPGGSTTIRCDVTNTVFNGTDLINVNVTIESDDISLSGNTSHTFSTIQPEETENITATASPSSTGEHSISCSAESDNGWGDVSSATITVTEEETNNGGGDNTNEETDTSNGGGGSFVSPDPEPTTNNESYTFTHQAGGELETQLEARPQFYGSLDAILETRNRSSAISFTADRHDCISGVRSYRSFEGQTNTTLTINYDCPAYLKRIVVFDTIPVSFGSFRNVTRATEMQQLILSTSPTGIAYTTRNISQGSRLSVKYQTTHTGSFDDFDAPLVIMKNHTLPAPEREPPTISTADIKTNISGDYQSFTVETSSSAICSMNLNGDKIIENVSAPFTHNQSFKDGSNVITITCEGEDGQQAIESYRVYRQPSESEKEGFLPLETIMSLLLAIVFLTGTYKYSRHIIKPARRKLRRRLMERRLDKMQKEFQEDNFDEVILHYNIVKELYQKLHGHPPDVSFWNQYFGDLGMALRIYLLLDLSVTQLKKGNDEKVVSTISNLQRLYSRMKESSNAEEIEKVRGKAKEFDKMLRRHGEQFNY